MKKIIKCFFILLSAVIIFNSCYQASGNDNPGPLGLPPVNYKGSYTVKDLNNNVIFETKKYISDIDLTDQTLNIKRFENQIGWADEEGNVYKLNSTISDCSGDKVFVPSCYKDNADSIGDIRLSDNNYVTAEQMAVLKSELSEPISVVISYPEDSSFWKLEMALEFIECKYFMTLDSEAAKTFMEYENRKNETDNIATNFFTFSDNFPQELYDLYPNERDGSKIYDAWCKAFSDGDTDKYPAFYFTHNCKKGGFTDWYLPSQYEIDGIHAHDNIKEYDFYSLTPKISKSLRACGFDYLFEKNRRPDFPLFQFFRAEKNHCVDDIYNYNCFKESPDYACAVRKF